MDIKGKLRSMQLYGIITEAVCRMSWLETARQIVESVDVLQLREKDLSDGEFLLRAHAIRELTSAAGTLFIVNDRPDIALLSDADGVHLGQEDISAQEVKDRWSDRLIVGVSTHSPAQAVAAEAAGADYIGVGPVLQTDTKDVEEVLGLEGLVEVCKAVELPAVAIGGIKIYNAGKVAKAGADAIAVVSALCGAEYPRRAARKLKENFGGTPGPLTG